MKIRYLVPAIAMFASYAVMGASALAGRPATFLIGVGLLLASETIVAFMRLPSFVESQFTPDARILAFYILVGVIAAQILPNASTFVVLIALAATRALESSTKAVERSASRRLTSSVQWRNVGIVGIRQLRHPFGHIRRIGWNEWLAFGAVLGAAIAWPDPASMPSIVLGASLFVVCLSAGAFILALNYRKASHRMLSGQERVQLLRDALEELEPTVVVHFGGNAAAIHGLNTWISTLESVRQRVIVVVREAVHLNAVRSTVIPVIAVPRASDLALIIPASVLVALYPTNYLRNTELIRFPGIRDVFVGHGDSDKGSSANPVSRGFDEIWVAGRAARDRYVRAAVGVRPEQVREVGRPQLTHIEYRPESRQDISAPFTVLYAPTFEGAIAAWSYSSVLSMGVELVRRLIAIPGIRVLYKPHPATGTVDPRYRVADRRIRTLLSAPGGPHRVVTRLEDLYTSFNEADTLISDISSVITDFLASGRPYLVTNPRGLDITEFIELYPSSAGAAIIDRDCSNLELEIADARGADSRRRHRAEVANYLLGDLTLDGVARFESAIDAAAAVALRHRLAAAEAIPAAGVDDDLAPPSDRTFGEQAGEEDDLLSAQT